MEAQISSHTTSPPNPPCPKSQKLPRTRTRFGIRIKTPRPHITSPIGPVKNSRGPDLLRSETLIMVDAISDCVTPIDHNAMPPSSNRHSSSMRRSEHLRAPSSQTGLASTTNLPFPSTPDVRQPAQLCMPAFSTSPRAIVRPTLKPSATLTSLPKIDSPLRNDENTPPQGTLG
jgi:hypothetical protein